MASSNGRKSDSQRPSQSLRASKSFSKTDPVSPARSSRNQRASTIQNGTNAEGPLSDKTNVLKENRMPRMQPNVPEKLTEVGDLIQEDGSTGKLPVDFDELPIELISLTDRLV